MRSIAILLFAVLLMASVSAPCQSNDPEGLWASTSLYRDSWGVPHIYAQHPRAMAFAFGYAQADDHAERMLLAYRYATGRASEVMGEKYAASDEFMIKVGHGPLAGNALQYMDSLTLELCEGFALGVNAWLSEHTSELPPWVTPVQPAEILALWHCYVLSFAPFDMPGAYRPLPGSQSGNAWAMAPARTQEKKSLLVINPHEYFDGPFRWYEAHLAVGDYDVAGFTLFGLPILLQGHNAALGWALTPNQPDTADMLEERLKRDIGETTDIPALYKLLIENEAVFQFHAQSQEYRVLTQNGFEVRSTPTHYSPLGPVFEGGPISVPARRSIPSSANNNGNYVITPSGGGFTGLYTWVVGGYNEFGGLRQLFEMGRAPNLNAFQGALATQQLPCFHVVYADQGGNIFYGYNARSRAKLAVDPNLVTAPNPWAVPVPQELRLAALGTPLSPSSLPALTNPRRGYIQACGNPPWAATTDGAVTASGWPFWFAEDPDSLRAQYVRDSLMAGLRSFDDMQAMVYDTYAPAAAEFIPKVLNTFGDRGVNPELDLWRDVLNSWTFLAETNSTGMTFFNTWWRILENELGPDMLPILYGDSYRGPESARLAAQQAAVQLNTSQRDGTMNDWGTIHQLPRGNRTESVFGSDIGEPIFLTSRKAHNVSDGGVHYGFSHAMVVRFDTVPTVASVSIFGTSENPQSSHFDDQLDLVLEKRFKYPAYSQDQVMRHAVSVHGRNIQLMPRGVGGEFQIAAPVPVTVVTETSTEAPAPLPTDQIAFTLYAKVELIEPEGALFTTTARLYVPEAVCAERNLNKLSLFAFNPTEGWVKAEGMVFDAVNRSWTATYNGSATFAVLGPADLMPKESVVQESLAQ